MESDDHRMGATWDDDLLIMECKHYGLPSPNQDRTAAERQADAYTGGYLRILLRHIYNNRDAVKGADERTIERQREKIAIVSSELASSDSARESLREAVEKQERYLAREQDHVERLLSERAALQAEVSRLTTCLDREFH